MKTSTVVWLGALGIGGYLLYRWAQQTIQQTAPALQPNLQSSIDAGTYNAQALRMGIGTPTGSVAGYG